MEDNIREAINILNQGGIVVYPTDTAFGIGCRIDNTDSIKRLFLIRKRPEAQAVPVLVDSIDMANKYWINIPDLVSEKLISQYWPGALTIVLPCKKEETSSLVRGGGDNVGIRMPNHSIAFELIHSIGVPLLGPSANFHGERTPYEFKDLDNQLLKIVDFVIPGECTIKQASTVIDCSITPWKVIREGAVELDYS